MIKTLLLFGLISVGVAHANGPLVSTTSLDSACRAMFSQAECDAAKIDGKALITAVVLEGGKCIPKQENVYTPNGTNVFSTKKECEDKLNTKTGDYFELSSNICSKKSGSYILDNSTIFSSEADCKKQIKAEVYSDTDFNALATDTAKSTYCKKFSNRKMKSGKCVERSAFGNAMAGAGSFIGEKISDISLSDVSSIADDMGVKDAAKKKFTLRQNPDKYLQEYCDDPRLDNDCMSIIKKPGKEELFLEKICEGDPIKSPECEAKFMALHKENAKAKYITDVCEDSPLDKLKCRQYFKEVKGVEKYYIALCSEEKEKEPTCKAEKILTEPTLDAVTKKSVFEQIHCGDDVDEEKRHNQCPKVAEEKEEPEESEADEPEEKDSEEEESDEDF